MEQNYEEKLEYNIMTNCINYNHNDNTCLINNNETCIECEKNSNGYKKIEEVQ